MSPPMTVTLPEQQEVLIAGAQAAQVSGTLGGREIAPLPCFDIEDLTVRTGTGNDTITIGPEGLTAYGWENLTIDTDGGNDLLIIPTTELKPTAVDQFSRTGDFGDAPNGDDLPQGAG